MSIDNNACENCGGTGQTESGVEYMGAHEIIGCDWCAGTGFEDILLGVDRLNGQLTGANSELQTAISDLRIIENRIKRVRQLLGDCTDDQIDYELNREINIILAGG